MVYLWIDPRDSGEHQAFFVLLLETGSCFKCDRKPFCAIRENVLLGTKTVDWFFFQSQCWWWKWKLRNRSDKFKNTHLLFWETLKLFRDVKRKKTRTWNYLTSEMWFFWTRLKLGQQQISSLPASTKKGTGITLILLLRVPAVIA